MIDADEETEPTAPVTAQAVFDTLGSERTRHFVRILSESPPEEPIPLWNLAARVTARELGQEPDEDGAIRMRYASLYQTHVTRLTAIGAVSTTGEENVLVIPHREVHTLDALLDDIHARVDQLNGKPRFPRSVITGLIDALRRR